jgi:hypothetical protein
VVEPRSDRSRAVDLDPAGGRFGGRPLSGVRAWGVPRKRVDKAKLIEALLRVAADLEREAIREREETRNRRV